MSDDDQTDRTGSDDGDSDWVRPLLADARVTDPVPAEVAARLDEVLASLQADRQRADARPAVAPGPVREAAAAVVVPLRRRAAPFLAAAAVVAVIGGVAIAQIVHNSSGSGSSATSESVASSASGAQPGTPRPSALERAPQAQKGLAGRLPRLAASTFGQDAARVMRDLSTSAATDTDGHAPSTGGTVENFDQAAPTATPTAPPLTSSPGTGTASPGPDQARCSGPHVAGAVTLPATLDGTLVALVFRPPSAVAQEVEAWSCDGTTLLAAASVPH